MTDNDDNAGMPPAQSPEAIGVHTAGPWRIGESWRPPVGNMPQDHPDRDANGNVFWGYHISGSGEHGGHILPTLAAVHNFPDQMEANARLIAAAPDLLEALQDAVDDLLTSMRFRGDGWGCTEDELVGRYRAAIAKALGQ